MENLVERLRGEAGLDDLAYRTVTVLMDAALKIEQLEAALSVYQANCQHNCTD